MPTETSTDGTRADEVPTAKPAAEQMTPAAERDPIGLHRWRNPADFVGGTHQGTRIRHVSDSGAVPGVLLREPVGTLAHPDEPEHTPVEYAQWLSQPRELDFGATRLVASWNAVTPDSTWIEVALRVRPLNGAEDGLTSSSSAAHQAADSRDSFAETERAWSPWYDMGRWASSDRDILRTTFANQTRSAEDPVTVAVDTLTARAGVRLWAYQLRVRFCRLATSTATPVLERVSVAASSIGDRLRAAVSYSDRRAWGTELPVPAYAQSVHSGHYPVFGGGGEAWCSPTAVQMVLEYWNKRPTRTQLSWVDPFCPDPTIDYAACNTYDFGFQGCGNWAFSTAYAGTFGLDSYVRWFRSLSDVEACIAAGIPVVTSQAFRLGELSGADYDTEGHLMVIVGFTKDGDVIVHDPAHARNDEVRVVFPRDQYSNIWLRTKRYDATGKVARSPGGIGYVITPPERADEGFGDALS